MTPLWKPELVEKRKPLGRKRYLVVKRIAAGALALFMLSMGLIFWSLSERIKVENKSLTGTK